MLVGMLFVSQGKVHRINQKVTNLPYCKSLCLIYTFETVLNIFIYENTVVKVLFLLLLSVPYISVVRDKQILKLRGGNSKFWKILFLRQCTLGKKIFQSKLRRK